MADLPWIKLYTGDWRKLVAGMSAAARAGMVDLVFTAWDRHGDDGAPACALLDDDEVLMRAAGLTEREWKAARADIRRRWRVHPSAPGYVQCPHIAAWYAEAHAAHASAAARGAKGGRAKAARTRQHPSSGSSSATSRNGSSASSSASSSALAQGVASQKSEVRGDVVPDLRSGDYGPPAADAAAAGAPPGGALASPAAADERAAAPPDAEPDAPALDAERFARLRALMAEEGAAHAPPSAEQRRAEAKAAADAVRARAHAQLGVAPRNVLGERAAVDALVGPAVGESLEEVADAAR